MCVSVLCCMYINMHNTQTHIHTPSLCVHMCVRAMRAWGVDINVCESINMMYMYAHRVITHLPKQAFNFDMHGYKH